MPCSSAIRKDSHSEKPCRVRRWKTRPVMKYHLNYATHSLSYHKVHSRVHRSILLNPLKAIHCFAVVGVCFTRWRRVEALSFLVPAPIGSSLKLWFARSEQIRCLMQWEGNGGRCAWRHGNSEGSGWSFRECSETHPACRTRTPSGGRGGRIPAAGQLPQACARWLSPSLTGLPPVATQALSQ